MPTTWKIKVDLGSRTRVTGLRPVMQKCLNFFTDSLPYDCPLVQSKFIDVYEDVRHALDKRTKLDHVAAESYANRVALYVLWRDVFNNHVSGAYSLSTSSRNLGERCPPFGITMSLSGAPTAFEAKYTCKHFLCPHCRLRRNLELWNKVNNNIEFQEDTPVTMIHLEATSTQDYNPVSTKVNLKFDCIKEIMAKVVNTSWRYQGAWTLSLTTEDDLIKATLKLGLMCPELPGRKYRSLKSEVYNFNTANALDTPQCYAAVDITPTKYTDQARENLFSKVIPSGLWPSSFMADYKNPISSTFAIDIGQQLSKIRTLGYLGPCNTVKKRLSK